MEEADNILVVQL